MSATLNEATGLTCQELPASEYHADAAIGASMLEDFRKSRRLYEGRYVTKTLPQIEPSEAMQLGTLIHLRVLEPERYKAEVVLVPADAPQRRSKADKQWWADFETANEGRHLIGQQTAERVEGAAASVFSKRWAQRLLKGQGQPEFSIFWNDHETGLNLKCRVDWFSIPVHTDLKTTEDAAPAKFVRRCVELGYHRKRAHYLAGIGAFTGEKEPLMVNVAVSTSAPFSCGAYNIGDFDSRMNKSLGVMEWRYTLRELAKCIETGDFSDVWEHEVMDLEYPAYAFTQSQYSM